MGTRIYCPEHPDIQTSLSCSQCERPVCPRCMIHAPVGIRCREHGQAARLPVYEVPVASLVRAIAMSLFLGLLGGAVFGVILPLAGYGGLHYLIAFAGFGFMMGESTSIATRRKRGRSLQYVAGGGVVVAYLTFVVISGRVPFLFDLLGVALGTYLAASRLR